MENKVIKVITVKMQVDTVDIQWEMLLETP